MIVLALITAGLAGGCVVVAAQKTRAFVEHVRATYRANVLLHGEIARLTGELKSAGATVELLEAALARKSAEVDGWHEVRLDADLYPCQIPPDANGNFTLSWKATSDGIYLVPPDLESFTPD